MKCSRCPEQAENWKAIPGILRYEVSDLARVRNAKTGHVLAQSRHGKYGYRCVCLLIDGKCTTRKVARLLLAAFVGPPPSVGHHAAHRNGNHADDRLGNLYWATPKENAADRLRHGRYDRGEQHYFAKLSEKEVSQLRARLRAGESAKSLARIFGIARCTVQYIRDGKKWKHSWKPPEEAMA